jgi:hypothetical protein
MEEARKLIRKTSAGVEMSWRAGKNANSTMENQQFAFCGYKERTLRSRADHARRWSAPRTGLQADD